MCIRDRDKPVAMFCTGGIRCEKTSIYLKKKGFKNIYQLNGGILNYLKKTKEKNSLWKGECFVFDNRISLKHGLKVGTYFMCSGCRKPITPKRKFDTFNPNKVTITEVTIANTTD